MNPLVEGKVDNIEKYLLCTTDFFFFFFYCYLEPQANARAQELLLFLLLRLFFFWSWVKPRALHRLARCCPAELGPALF